MWCMENHTQQTKAIGYTKSMMAFLWKISNLLGGRKHDFITRIPHPNNNNDKEKQLPNLCHNHPILVKSLDTTVSPIFLLYWAFISFFVVVIQYTTWYSLEFIAPLALRSKYDLPAVFSPTNQNQTFILVLHHCCSPQHWHCEWLVFTHRMRSINSAQKFRAQQISVWEVKWTHSTADSGQAAHHGLQVGPTSPLAPWWSACTSKCKIINHHSAVDVQLYLVLPWLIILFIISLFEWTSSVWQILQTKGYISHYCGEAFLWISSLTNGRFCTKRKNDTVRNLGAKNKAVGYLLLVLQGDMGRSFQFGVGAGKRWMSLHSEQVNSS